MRVAARCRISAASRAATFAQAWRCCAASSAEPAEPRARAKVPRVEFRGIAYLTTAQTLLYKLADQIVNLQFVDLRNWRMSRARRRKARRPRSPSFSGGHGLRHLRYRQQGDLVQPRQAAAVLGGARARRRRRRDAAQIARLRGDAPQGPAGATRRTLSSIRWRRTTTSGSHSVSACSRRTIFDKMKRRAKPACHVSAAYGPRDRADLLKDVDLLRLR